MRNTLLKTATLAAAGWLATGSALAAVLGPTVYTSQADSPFSPASFANFYLEDAEDNAINTLGLTVSGSSLCIGGFSCFAGSTLIDSIGNGGNGAVGRSIFANGPTGITITFDAVALGGLPTVAGLAWTDGTNSIFFEAFDQNGVSLGTASGNHADGSFNGTLVDDRFYGATNAGGISRLFIRSGTGGIEIDHVQYGLNAIGGAVPETATWGMMTLGFGIAGGALRYRRRRKMVATMV